MTGGRWVTEKYDFMSLPLWVRENSLLPLGKSATEVEYDYADGVELLAWKVTKPVEIEIPDGSGRTVARFRATPGKDGAEITAETEKPWTVKQM